MTYKFDLTKEQLVIVSEALAMMPYHRVAELIAELRKQLATQQEQTVQ